MGTKFLHLKKIVNNQEDWDILKEAIEEQKIISLLNKEDDKIIDDIVPITITTDALICIRPITWKIFELKEVSNIKIIEDISQEHRRLGRRYDLNTNQIVNIDIGPKLSFECEVKDVSIRGMALHVEDSSQFTLKSIAKLSVKNWVFRVKITHIGTDNTIGICYDFFTGKEIAQIFELPEDSIRPYYASLEQYKSESARQISEILDDDDNDNDDDDN